MRQPLIVILSLLFIHLCLGQRCQGQNAVAAWISGDNRESLAHVRDSVIRNEAAQFSRKGASLRSLNETSPVKLLPIPLKRCSDNFVYFEKGTLIALQVLIHIFLTEADVTRADTNTKINNNTRVENINLLFYKTPLVFPDSAFADIYGPKACGQFTKKNRPVSSDCKAFISADNRRVYIYMLNGEGKDRYEVTWVVQDRKYLTRIIDREEPKEKG